MPQKLMCNLNINYFSVNFSKNRSGLLTTQDFKKGKTEAD